jgi:DNA-binding transcriptional LysR family regulator
MEVLVRVVEAGSLTKAAHVLHLSPSAVSKLLARLEARLGATLLRRSARGLALTPEGEAYFNRARAILREIETAEDLVAVGREPRGLLRINCNIPFAEHCLVPILPAFLSRYPELAVDLVQTDRPVDLIRSQADVAIRTGVLVDSSLRARRLFESSRHVVASPDYLARFGTPATPADLVRHECLGFNLRRSLDLWPFRSRTGEIEEHFATGRLRLDNGETMRRMALAGVGIARLSEFHIGRDLREGRLVAILEDVNPGDREPIHAVYLEEVHLPDRIRVFIDFLVRMIGRD